MSSSASHLAPGRRVDRPPPAVRRPRLGERREDAVRLAVVLGHPPRRHGVRRPGADQLDALRGQRLLDRGVALASVGAVVRRDVDALGAHLLRGEQHPAGRSAAHHLEAGPPLAQRGVERGQAGDEVGAPRPAGRTPERGVDHEQREDLTVGAGLDQRRVVREPQVAAEPHHRCHRRSLCQQRRDAASPHETEWGGERSDRHHRDVPPDHLRAGRGGHRPAARADRRTAAPERPDRLADGGPDGARRPAHRRGRPAPRADRARGCAWRPG